MAIPNLLHSKNITPGFNHLSKSFKSKNQSKKKVEKASAMIDAQ